MSSTTLPELLGPETPGAIFGALGTVAERSFFAVAERSDEPAFAGRAAAVSSWLVSTVRFTERAAAGVMSCSVPVALADRLFHAFTGREPSEPADPADVHDLIGELANMICGAWLSRAASGRAFDLGQPAVIRSRTARAAGSLRLYALVDDAPIAVTVTIESPGAAGVSGARA